MKTIKNIKPSSFLSKGPSTSKTKSHAKIYIMRNQISNKQKLCNCQGSKLIIKPLNRYEGAKVQNNQGFQISIPLFNSFL